MLARTYTAMMMGLDAIKVDVEVDGARGIPSLSVIGLTSKATAEAKERITSAVQNCGIHIKSKRTIVNLAPADVPKTSSSFDLAIAVGLLKMFGELRQEYTDTLFFGELALDGQLKPVHGALPLVLAARRFGFQHVILPNGNHEEVQTIHGIRIHPLHHLEEFLVADRTRQPLAELTPQPFQPTSPLSSPLFDQIIGQRIAKRALTIAAAGHHNILLIGPPGVGKSLLAKSLTAILPPLTEEEALEVTQIHSIAGLTDGGMVTTRPFRMIHHTISSAGLIGGGPTLRPGEISLAHRGVLLLDELLEFPPALLNFLRQPLEDHDIRISRVIGSTTFPANFLLVAASNPCPCGYAGSRVKKCPCSPFQKQRYQQRLSGPFLDRIDLCIAVTETPAMHESLPREHHETQTAQLLIGQAVAAQTQRFASTAVRNGFVPHHLLDQHCRLPESAQTVLKTAARQFHLSWRSYYKILRVARTIADMAGRDNIVQDDVMEAIHYRTGGKLFGELS